MADRTGRAAPARWRPAGTWLAFDYGDKRLGVAGGQTVTRVARPIETIPQRGRRGRHGHDDHVQSPDWRRLGRIIDEWRPCALVVGVPYTKDGRQTPLIKRIRRFIADLESRYNLPVFDVDERLSSYAARACLRAERKPAAGKTARNDIDAAAAAVILQTWFDARYEE